MGPSHGLAPLEANKDALMASLENDVSPSSLQPLIPLLGGVSQLLLVSKLVVERTAFLLAPPHLLCVFSL